MTSPFITDPFTPPIVPLPSDHPAPIFTTPSSTGFDEVPEAVRVVDKPPNVVHGSVQRGLGVIE
ncbi:hypothetical protein HDV00_010686, partial [Rhizophlyctis rosea]